MPFDPTKPAANSQVSSAEMRGQLLVLLLDLRGLVFAVRKNWNV